MRSISHYILSLTIAAVGWTFGCNERTTAPSAETNGYPQGTDAFWKGTTWTYRVTDSLAGTTDTVQARIGDRTSLQNGEPADIWLFSCENNPALNDTQYVSHTGEWIRFYDPDNLMVIKTEDGERPFRQFPTHPRPDLHWEEGWRYDSILATSLLQTPAGIRTGYTVQGRWYAFNEGGQELMIIAPDTGILFLHRTEVLWTEQVNMVWELIGIETPEK